MSNTGPQLIVTMSSDEAKLWRGLQNIIDQEKKVEKGGEGISAAARKAERDLERFAQRTKQIDTTPAERMRNEMVKLNEALKKSLLTQEQYNRARERVVRDYKGSLPKPQDTGKSETERLDEDLRKFAAQTKQINATPLERYRQEVAKLDDALRRGILTQHDYNRAKTRLTVEQARGQQVDPRVAKDRDELKRFAEQTKRIDATPVQRYRAELAKLDAAFKKNLLTQDEYTRAHQRLQNEFNRPLKTPIQEQHNELEGILGTVKGVATTWISIQGAIRGANHLLETHQKLLDRGSAETKRLETSRQGISQVADSAADEIGAQQRAKQLAVTEGYDRGEILKLMTDAANYGIPRNSAFIEKAVKSNIILNPNEVVRTGGTLAGIYDGKVTPEQAANAAYAASKSSVLDFNQMAPALQSAATSAKSQGASLEEVSAIMGVLPKRLGAEKAATRTARFAAEMTKFDDLRGKGVLAAVEKLQGMSRDQRETYLGDSIEVHEGYSAISDDLKAIRELLPEIRSAMNGTGSSRDVMVAQTAQAWEADARNGGLRRALKEAEAAKQAADIAVEERYAASGYLRDQGKDVTTSVLARRDRSVFSHAIYGLGNYGYSLMGDDMTARSAAATSAAQRAQAEGKGVLAANAEAFRLMFSASMDEVAQELQRATRELSSAATELRRGAASNGARVQRQGASYAEGGR